MFGAMWSCVTRHCSPVLMLTRLTADCMLNGLDQSGVFFGRKLDKLPDESVSRWLLIVLVCDDASSNRKIAAHVIFIAQSSRKRVLVFVFKCMAHLCNGCIAPVVKNLKLAGPLFRAAHVMVLARRPLCSTRLENQ